MAYSWPGNVRELENVVQRGLALTRGNILHIENVPVEVRDDGPGPVLPRGTGEGPLAEGDPGRPGEPDHPRDPGGSRGGNRSRTAELLRIHRRYLYSKMKQYKHPLIRLGTRRTTGVRNQPTQLERIHT